jgi:flagellar FliJ protein
MKRFTFRLESLRTLREQAEEQAKLRLAHELAAEAAERERLVAATGRLGRARERAAAGGATGDELAALQVYVERCEREVVAAGAMLAVRGQAVEAARGALSAAAQEREALERLRERQRAGHVHEQRRVEGVLLDEVGLAAHRRRVA